MTLIGEQARQSGLSLIELMIAMVLGLLIMAGVIELFVGNSQINRSTTSLSQMQDNSRFALNLLSKDIRTAGYSGCREIKRINLNTIASGAVAAVDNDSIIEGEENWGAGVVSTTLGAVKAGSDVLSVQHALGCGATLIGNLATANSDIEVNAPNTCNLNANQVLMISDCEDAHIFKATSVTNGINKQTITYAESENLANKFCKKYPTLPQVGNCTVEDGDKLYGFNAEVYKFISISYFVRDDQNGLPALWIYDHNSVVDTVNAATLNPKVLVEGINDLQMKYGVDDNYDDVIDRYADAQVITNASDWGKVISVEVSLLVQSQNENLTLNAQEITYNGTTTTVADGHIQRVYNTTIAVRNRVQ